MAVHFKTKTPKKLLSAFKAAVDSGQVRTWKYDEDGDFTHTADQWINKAWMRPKIVDGQDLIFHILAPREVPVSSPVYAIYHGRVIESFLSHCDQLFETAYASALPEIMDVVD